MSNITMAVFDVAQHVVSQSGSLIAGSTAVDGSTLATIQSTLEAMDVGPLFGIFLQSFAVKFLFEILSILIWAIVYGRMIEIYLTISLAPIPFATFGNREQSMIGQNYLRSLEPNHALARDSFPYILSTADAVLFFCYNSRKPA